jgi:TatD DNase family protein
MYELIDIGANLAHTSFDDDRDEVLARAAAAGVRRLIVTGTSVTDSARAFELTEGRRGQLFSTAGIHPHHAEELDEHSRDALGALLANAAVVAVGECGLDYFRNFSPRQSQIHAFETQLELAVDTQLPVFLHQRDAHEDFVAALRSIRDRLVGGVAHCFTGGPAELEAYLDLDLYIGVTGWVCDERRGHALREALPDIPLDRLLLETDAPYLLPRDIRPPPRHRRNEPGFLAHVAERVAAGVGRSIEEVAAASTANAERLFGLPSV